MLLNSVFLPCCGVTPVKNSAFQNTASFYLPLTKTYHVQNQRIYSQYAGIAQDRVLGSNPVCEQILIMWAQIIAVYLVTCNQRKSNRQKTAVSTVPNLGPQQTYYGPSPYCHICILRICRGRARFYYKVDQVVTVRGDPCFVGAPQPPRMQTGSFFGPILSSKLDQIFRQ